MGAKARLDKRRLSREVEIACWASVFGAGYDFFGELAAIGVKVDAYGRPDTAPAADAWHRLGAAVIAANPTGGQWALDRFGAPRA